MDIDAREDRQDDIALLELASMIDEDRPIDWDSKEGAARGDDERALLAGAAPPGGAHAGLSRSRRDRRRHLA